MPTITELRFVLMRQVGNAFPSLFNTEAYNTHSTFLQIDSKTNLQKRPELTKSKRKCNYTQCIIKSNNIADRYPGVMILLGLFDIEYL